jgi:hypothetical protein
MLCLLRKDAIYKLQRQVIWMLNKPKPGGQILNTLTLPWQQAARTAHPDNPL